MRMVMAINAACVFFTFIFVKPCVCPTPRHALGEHLMCVMAKEYYHDCNEIIK